MEKKRKKLERKRKKESKTAGDKNAIRKERKCNPPSPQKKGGKNKGKKTAQHSIFRSRRVLTGSLEFEAEWGGNGKKKRKDRLK